MSFPCVHENIILVLQSYRKQMEGGEEGEEEGEEEPLEWEGEEEEETPLVVADAYISSFDSLFLKVKDLKHKRRKTLEFQAVSTEDEKKATSDNLGSSSVNDAEGGLGKRLPTDEYAGDTNMRTLKALLHKVDVKGWERSAHQLEFHSAFMRATARVLYREDWAVSRPLIMKKNGWTRCAAEVMISTPRRFGKTFS